MFSSASSITRTRAVALAIAASADLTRASDTSRTDSAPVSAAVVVMPSFISARCRSSGPRVLAAGGDGLHALRLRLGDGAPRRLELRVDVGVLDLRDDLALADARPFLDPEHRDPAAHLDADIAAVPRHHVAGGDEDRQRLGLTRCRGGHLRHPHHVDFRRPLLVPPVARRWIGDGAAGRQHQQQEPRQPRTPPRRVAIDAQRRKIIDLNCHGSGKP